MPKIVFIGGGSSKFVRELAVDFFHYDELKSAEIVLMDIDQERLGVSCRLVERIIREMNVPATCRGTTDRREALAGADYVIITFMVGGFDKYRSDVDIPAKYGVFQTISDSTGPGALMRIVRTAPVLQAVAQELRELAPEAWVLNYANPMAMNTLTLLRSGHRKSIGLCHSIQGCLLWNIKKWLGISPDEIDVVAGGINHINFYLSIKHKGRDLYEILQENRERIIKEYPAEQLRFTLLDKLGYFPAEGPQHQAEYYSWFMKDIPTGETFGAQFRAGYQNDSRNAEKRKQESLDILDGKMELALTRSHEYAAGIIHSFETGSALEIYGNVSNTGLITNLPPESIVEVPCLVGKDVIKPCYVGKLPPQLAAVMTPHCFLYELAVDAVMKRDKTLLLKALQIDPLTSAVLTLPQIEAMLNEMCDANSEYMTDWN